jgi:hypothetical protein
MKRTALLAVAAFLLAVGPATAATHATRGVVVAKRARAGTIILSGAKGVGITVHVSSQRVRLGDRVSVVGKRVRVLSHVRRAMIRGVVVKRVTQGFRIASGPTLLTIHTNRRALSSDGNDLQLGTMGEFEIEIEDDGVFEEGFIPVSQTGIVEVEAKGAVVDSSATQLTISAGGGQLTFAAPDRVQLPLLATGTLVEVRGVSVNGVLTVQRLRAEDGDGNDGDSGGGDGGGHH